MGSLTEIGEIVNVSGSIISVQLSDSIKSNTPVIDGVVYRVGQIGSFLKVPLGYSNLYGIVTQIGAAAIPDNLHELYLREGYEAFGNKQWLNMVLVGERIGTRFERGVSQSPTTGDKVHLVTIDDLSVIYGGYDESNSICIGSISVSESLNAMLDLNKLISRHSAILGSTGSGKSNSVTVLLSAIADKKLPSARILIVDPHGEYSSAFLNKSNVYEISESSISVKNRLYIPFWALPFDELISIFSGNLSDTNRDYLRSRIVEAKKNAIIANKIIVDDNIITADTPIPFSIKKLWFELDDFERQTYNERAKPETKTELRIRGDAEALISNEYQPAGIGSSSPFLNNAAKGMLNFLDSMRVRIRDSRYSFLFEPGEFTPDLSGKTTKDIDILLNHWLGSDRPITILDLSGIPSEIMVSISGTLLKIIYDSLFWGQNLSIGGREQPLLVVLEEAHNYLKAGEDSISSKTVQSIAKEGRKYGIGLMLVTQRPSELDETVLSQCGTIIALRMNNSKDRNHIKSSVQDELQSIIDLLPSLRTGEAIISGEAVKIPSRVRFYKAIHMTKSSDPIVSEAWGKTQTELPSKYKKLVEKWRNRNL